MYTDIRRFEWDKRKARRNAMKHGVNFKEASTVVDDPEALTTYDAAHSEDEDREWLIGFSFKERLLVVVYTIRPGAVMRIISARLAGLEERIRYENNRSISF